jgi:hypothetical protein
MKRFCNFYECRSDKFHVTITHDVWDGDGAERTQGTITIDGEVRQWYVKPWGNDRDEITIVIDGKEVSLSSYWKDGTPMNPADEILDALGTRHCPETSNGCHDHQCPVCRGETYETIAEVNEVTKALLASDIKTLYEFTPTTRVGFYAQAKASRMRRDELNAYAFQLTQTPEYQDEVKRLTERFIENPELMTSNEVPHQFSGAWNDAVIIAEHHLEHQKAQARKEAEDALASLGLGSSEDVTIEDVLGKGRA